MPLSMGVFTHKQTIIHLPQLLAVGMKKNVGANHKVIHLDDNGAVLAKLSDRPETP